MVMELEQNLPISKMDVDEHPKAKVEVKKGKSKDQNQETLLLLLKKREKLSKEMNSRDRLYMNKLTTLERAQKVISQKGNLSLGSKIRRISQSHLKFPTLWLQQTLWSKIHPMKMSNMMRMRVMMKKLTSRLI